MGFYIALIAAFLLVALVLIRRYLRAFPLRPGMRRFLLRAFPAVELFIWLGFGLWALNRVFGRTESFDLLLPMIFLVLILAGGWYFLRDFIAGVILKAEMPLEPGQYIRTPHIQGVLKKTGYRSAEVESDTGHSVRIPYSRLTGEILGYEIPAGGLKQREIELRISDLQPMHEVREKITAQLLLLPWISPGERPHIRIGEQGPGYNIYHIRFHALSDRQAAYVAGHLKKLLGPDASA
jgi:small-conductance mechanosensitive channel